MCWRNVWPAQVDGEIVSSAISADCFFTPQPSQLCDYCFLSPALQITVFCHLLVFLNIRAPLSLVIPLYIGALTFYPSPMWLLRRLLAYSVCLFFFIIPKPQMHSQCWTLTLFTSGPIYLCPGVATFCILLNLSSDPNKSFFCETLPFYWSRADTHSCLRLCSKHLFNDMNVIACFVLFKPNSHNK